MFALKCTSLRRYRVEGRLPSPGGEAFCRALAAKAFEPLGAHDSREERAFGWVSAGNLLVTQFDPGRVMIGDTACFAFRLDRRRVPSRLLRARFELESKAREEALAEGGGRRRRLDARERRALRESLRGELLEQAFPVVDAWPVLYRAARDEVLIGTTQPGANRLFVSHFCDTFDVSLSHATPWRRAEHLLASEARREALADLEPASFAPPAPAARSRERV